VLEQADLLVIAAPHHQYTQLAVETPIVDMWGLTNQGVRI
jgi:UDP-N-acetyl-D-mannosaminuronic acid dehydrogenase